MRCPPEYPYVIVNMAMSADGKISTRRREPITLGTARDRLLMDQLRARADAVIIGAGTLRVDGYPLLVRNSVIRRRRIARGVEPHPVNILLSRSLDIPTRRLFFTDPNTRKIVYTRRAANPLKRKQLARYVEFVLVPGRSSFLKYVLRDLAGRGLRKVLVEGGGELNFSFFKEGLVDEL
jgi:riboflavin-specific deaminase-like protein